VSEELSDREQALSALLAGLVSEMAQLRDFPLPPTDADPPTVHDALRALRGRLDRAEAIKNESARQRRKAARAARRRNYEADAAYDEHLEKLSGRAVTREYESIRDREVLARTKSSPLRREARAAERLADLTEEADDVIRSLYFSMRDIRKELLATLESYLPWVSHLEHT
jgi:hypothetical protein